MKVKLGTTSLGDPESFQITDNSGSLIFNPQICVLPWGNEGTVNTCEFVIVLGENGSTFVVVQDDSAAAAPYQQGEPLCLDLYDADTYGDHPKILNNTFTVFTNSPNNEPVTVTSNDGTPVVMSGMVEQNLEPIDTGVRWRCFRITLLKDSDGKYKWYVNVTLCGVSNLSTCALDYDDFTADGGGLIYLEVSQDFFQKIVDSDRIQFKWNSDVDIFKSHFNPAELYTLVTGVVSVADFEIRNIFASGPGYDDTGTLNSGAFLFCGIFPTGIDGTSATPKYYVIFREV